MPHMALQIGRWAVTPLCDAVGVFLEELHSVLPGVDEATLAAARLLAPDAFLDDSWQLHFHCFHLTDGRRQILVDTGIGPASAPARSWAPVPGRLPTELAEVGSTPSDIDTVVLTHLHSDHTGWSTDLDSAPPTPLFPNAQYVVQRRELSAFMAAAAEPPQPGEMLHHVVEPLLQADQLRLCDGAEPLDRDVRLIATPGHTPGHQSLIVDAGDTALVVAGDVVVHPAQVVTTETPYAYEDDVETARSTRRGLLEWVRQHNAVLATAHLPSPLVTSTDGHSLTAPG